MSTTIYCLAPGCKNNSRTTAVNEPPVFYHRIKDDQKWHKFCSLNRKDKFPQKLCERPELSLCSAHFRPEDYQVKGESALFESGKLRAFFGIFI